MFTHWPARGWPHLHNARHFGARANPAVPDDFAGHPPAGFSRHPAYRATARCPRASALQRIGPPPYRSRAAPSAQLLTLSPAHPSRRCGRRPPGCRIAAARLRCRPRRRRQRLPALVTGRPGTWPELQHRSVGVRYRSASIEPPLRFLLSRPGLRRAEKANRPALALFWRRSS